MAGGSSGKPKFKNKAPREETSKEKKQGKKKANRGRNSSKENRSTSEGSKKTSKERESEKQGSSVKSLFGKSNKRGNITENKQTSPKKEKRKRGSRNDVIEPEVKKSNVYQHFRHEELNLDPYVQPSNYLKLLVKTLDKRNVSGLTNIKEEDFMMKDIKEMIKELQSYDVDFSDYLLDDTNDEDVNMGVQYNETSRKRTGIQVV